MSETETTCRYGDCAEGHRVASDEPVTCATCRSALGLPALRVVRCQMAECCGGLPKYRESDPVDAPGHYARVREPGWCASSDE